MARRDSMIGNSHSPHGRTESSPRLSVVVTITKLSEELHRCLFALENQCGVSDVEIVVPYDPESDDIEPFRRAHPSVNFVVMDRVPPEARSDRPGLAHLMYDRRRSVGLGAARGELIAITEDRAVPRRNWCATISELHRNPYAAIGGAIENASPRVLNQAVYFCDFLRYQNPVPEGPASYISDINVSYKRSALEEIRAVWEEAYHEPGVHGALRARGGTLWLSPEMIVDYDRGRLEFGQVIRERFAWARLFAGRRACEVSLLKRVVLAMFSPALPVVLLGRRVAVILRTRRNFAGMIAALPLVCTFLTIGAIGEFVGYVTASPIPRSSREPLHPVASSAAGDRLTIAQKTNRS